MLNRKYLYICTELHAEYLLISDYEETTPSLAELDGKYIKKLKMIMALGHDQTREFQPLNKFLTTLVNLTSLRCSQVCNNDMLKIISKTCPYLEEVYIEMCTDVDDEGLYHLSGYIPSQETYSNIRDGAKVPVKSGCKRLKTVNCEYTCAGARGAAMLLHLCPVLEELLIPPDVNMGDVFTLLHGTNTDRYEEVTTRYALRVLNNYMELDEDILALIVRTCPGLKDISLRCNGVERKDRNLLANLLGLKTEVLNVKNCSMSALLWYLEQRGSDIKSLAIQHLSMAPMSLTFTRSHLQDIIKICPKLENFTLKLNNSPIQPDRPYSSFGSNLVYFTSLTHLTLEGLSITHEDLSVLISKCNTLLELHILILNLEMLEDNVLYEFLSSGCLQSLQSLYLHRPLLTYEGLKRLIRDCPKLHTVGPLSSW
ncbi:hypothetical protein SK128_002679, partial [Halocaridina rubra]